jgi:3-oxoacyl-ACP reductase-like protein
MSIFETLKNAIFGQQPSSSQSTAATAGTGAPARAAAGIPAGAASSAAPSAGGPAQGAMSRQALESHLQQLSARNQQKLNWQTSIVDLMKLVNLDPSLANRMQLAHELGYRGSTSDTAQMNIWLHEAVMTKLAEEGGRAGGGLH